MVTPERRLDRLEGIVKLTIKAGRRERRETRENINALIDAQMRTEAVLAHTQEELAQHARSTDTALAELARAQVNTQEALAQFARRTDEELVRLAHAQADTNENLKTLIETVDRIAGERGNGKE